jgi:transposase
MNQFQLRPREYQALEALTKQCHDAVSVQRAHALLGLQEGMSPGEIADLAGVSRQTVYNWAQAFQERGHMNVAERLRDAPRCGRPATVLSIIDPLLDAVINDDPRAHGYRATVWTAPLLQHYLEEVHGVSTSSKSVSRALARLRLRWKRPRHSLAQRSPTWQQAKGG